MMISLRKIMATSAAFAMLLPAPLFAQMSGKSTFHSPAATAPAPHESGQTVSSSASGGTGTPRSTSSPIMTTNNQVRVSKLIGSTVYNDQHQNIGSIDELLLDQNHQVTNAVLSVGGFLGVGSKLVEVPYQNLHIANNTITMPNATQDDLKKMPTYTFNGAS